MSSIEILSNIKDTEEIKKIQEYHAKILSQRDKVYGLSTYNPIGNNFRFDTEYNTHYYGTYYKEKRHWKVSKYKGKTTMLTLEYERLETLDYDRIIKEDLFYYNNRLVRITQIICRNVVEIAYTDTERDAASRRKAEFENELKNFFVKKMDKYALKNICKFFGIDDERTQLYYELNKYAMEESCCAKTMYGMYHNITIQEEFYVEAKIREKIKILQRLNELERRFYTDFVVEGCKQ